MFAISFTGIYNYSIYQMISIHVSLKNLKERKFVCSFINKILITICKGTERGHVNKTVQCNLNTMRIPYPNHLLHWKTIADY